MKIKDLVASTVYSNASSSFKAVKVNVAEIVDNVLCPGTSSRMIEGENGHLQPGDVVLVIKDLLNKDIVDVGFYHPDQKFDQPVVARVSCRVLRPHTVEDGIRLFLALLPWTGRMREWAQIRDLDAPEVSSEKLETFQKMLWDIHELRENHREQGKLLGELLRSVAHGITHPKPGVSA